MTTHDVQIAAASKLRVNRLGTGLLTGAWTPDQVVEALEVQGHRWGLGVQWSPEDGDDPRLFEALIAVAKTAVQAAVPAPPEVTSGRSKRKRHAARSS